MILIGETTNEIAALARQLEIPCRTIKSLDDLASGSSVGNAEVAEAVWITPTAYPEVTVFSPEHLQRINEVVARGSRVVVEYDVPLSAAATSSSRRCNFERLVVRQIDHPVTSDLQALDLLEAHHAYFQHIEALPSGSRELISIARVAGFDTAVFGLPDATVPALVDFSISGASAASAGGSTGGALLWASMSISSPAFRRYKPIGRWMVLLERMLRYLEPERTLLNQRSAIYPGATRLQPPPISDGEREERYKQAILSNFTWYERAGMLIDSSGAKGVLEGLHSTIDIDGTQEYVAHEGKPNERADCNVQSAVAFLSGAKVLGDKRHTAIGRNLLEFSISNFQYKDRSVYSGLWRWFRTGYEKTVFYSDDNGWAGFLTLFWGATNGDRKAVESGLRTAVALRDTWGANGHRRRRIDLPDFYEVGGREGFRDESPDQPLYKSPHYEASAMATLALASILTKDRSFVNKTTAGLDDYLEKWPAGILFQHSENDDGSKLITALLFAAEATGDRRYSEKAREILQGFVDVQLACGAIPDIDTVGNRYGKNRSNADYGTFESSLFQDPDDLVTDQVYGASFLLLAFYFAGVFFPGDPSVEKAKIGLADYLVQIQVKDSGRTFLDGGWMRGFDPVRWEYYGAAGDWGYGPYLLETGWCQAIIVLGLSWIVGGTFTGSFDDSIKEYAAVALARIDSEQRNIQKNWKDHTPAPEKRAIAADEPDVMI